jgi:hypothetical protein
MQNRGNTTIAGYIFAVGFGALAGGALIAVATKAIPKMMSKMMSQMMTTMMSEMGDGDCQPADI